MRRASRTLLWAWAFLSLMLLAYAAVALFTSTPADAVLVGMRHGPEDAATRGGRMLVAPLGAPGAVRGLAEPDAAWAFGEAGAVLVFADNATPRGIGVARAIFRAQWNETTKAYDLPALNLTNATAISLRGVPVYNATTGNRTSHVLHVTLDASRSASGFIVKGDAEPLTAARFVEEANVRGRVATIFPSSLLYGALAIALVSVVLPVALLVGVQPRGRRGGRALGDGSGARCHECATPAEPDATFCLRCGALLNTQGPEEAAPAARR